MKKLLLLFCFACVSVSAQDTVFAIVRGTTVEDVWQYNPARFTPTLPTGTTNVANPPDYVGKGWLYVAPRFLQPDGSPPPESKVAKADRTQLMADTIADGELALKNWDSLTAAKQKDVLKRCLQIILALLKSELKEALEIKEPGE